MKGDPQRELIVFTAALEVPIPQRNALLERLCGGDENLRHKVERLLGAQDRLGDFLEQPATAAILTPLLRKSATDSSSLPNAQGRDHKKEETRFQTRLRKRKGKNEK